MSEESKEPLTENQIEIKYLELADELGFKSCTISWVGACIVTLSKRKKEADGTTHVSAEEVCTALIKDIVSLYDEQPEKCLSDIKITSSDDVGKIVEGLVRKGLIHMSENDSINDFTGLFYSNALDPFLDKHSIKRKGVTTYNNFRVFIWLVWIVGVTLVILNWVNIVNHKTGMIGFYLSLAGFILSFIKPPNIKRF